MARTWQQNGTQKRMWTAAFWFTGIVLFMMELNAGMDYVESRLASQAPNFLGAVPAWGLTAWKLAESAFWNYGQLEVVFRVIPFLALPFALLGLAFSMKGSIGFTHQRRNERAN